MVAHVEVQYRAPIMGKDEKGKQDSKLIVGTTSSVELRPDRQSGEPDPEEAIGRMELDPSSLRTFQHHELMPQGDDLQLGGGGGFGTRKATGKKRD